MKKCIACEVEEKGGSCNFWLHDCKNGKKIQKDFIKKVFKQSQPILKRLQEHDEGKRIDTSNVMKIYKSQLEREKIFVRKKSGQILRKKAKKKGMTFIDYMDYLATL